MKFELKGYKLQKIKNCFKKEPIIFVFNISNTNAKNWLNVEQKFYKYNLKCTKVCNTLSKKSLNNSVFKNAGVLMNGSICLVYLRNAQNFSVALHKITKINPSLILLGLKLNNKIYSANQIHKISNINYKQSIKVFNNSLKKLISMPYQRLKRG